MIIHQLNMTLLSFHKKKKYCLKFMNKIPKFKSIEIELCEIIDYIEWWISEGKNAIYGKKNRKKCLRF
jgi:hypothetical protein